MNLNALMLFTAVIISSLASAQVKQEYKAEKVTTNGQIVRMFVGEQHNLMIEPLNNEGDRPIYLNDTNFRLHVESKKRAMLYKNDSIVAELGKENIIVKGETYRIKAGNSKEWKYLKDGEPALTCSYGQRQKEKYLSLNFGEATTDTDILTVVALYHGEGVIKQKSTAPYLWGIILAGAVMRFALVQN